MQAASLDSALMFHWLWDKESHVGILCWTKGRLFSGLEAGGRDDTVVL